MRIIVILVLLFPFILVAQIPRTNVEDAFREIDEDKLTLRFFDALTGNPIPNAAIQIQALGQQGSTNDQGEFYFPIPENDGEYPFTFTCDGYIQSTLRFQIMAGTLFYNRFSISPNLLGSNVRIILDWEKNPADLDAHLVKKNGYHISYRNMKSARDSVATLDRDDTNGYGPETITIHKLDVRGHYLFYVHDYTNRSRSNNSGLSGSKAHILVYNDTNQLVDSFIVPEHDPGTCWPVFEIINGDIQFYGAGIVNSITF